jgi:S1-C subfamily serine protease
MPEKWAIEELIMNLSGILADPDLLSEVSARIKSGAFSPGFDGFDRELTVENLNNIAMGENLAIGFDIEAIIMEIGRPALFVKNDTFAIPDSDIWTNRLESNRTALEGAISSVGRIELKNHPRLDWVGTGWVVRENVVVTNRHVAEEFSIRDGAKLLKFRRNHENKEIGARIDLREEYMQPDEVEFRVVKVLYIEEPEGPDIAFLEVEFTGSNVPKPIKLSSAAVPGLDVAVIGFPAWDGKRNDPTVMRRLFNDIYGVKRLQPGKVVTVESGHFSHDCTTLGGNSGSPVIDISTGEAVGLHFAGSYLKENLAVPAGIIKDRLGLI